MSASFGSFSQSLFWAVALAEFDNCMCLPGQTDRMVGNELLCFINLRNFGIPSFAGIYAVLQYTPSDYHGSSQKASEIEPSLPKGLWEFPC